MIDASELMDAVVVIYGRCDDRCSCGIKHRWDARCGGTNWRQYGDRACLLFSLEGKNHDYDRKIMILLSSIHKPADDDIDEAVGCAIMQRFWQSDRQKQFLRVLKIHGISLVGKSGLTVFASNALPSDRQMEQSFWILFIIFFTPIVNRAGHINGLLILAQPNEGEKMKWCSGAVSETVCHGNKCS